MANAGASKDVRWIVCPFSELSEFDWLYASVVAQMVQNLPAMPETQVQSLGWENPLEEGIVTHSSILAWRIPMDRGTWRGTIHGVTMSWTQLSD